MCTVLILLMLVIFMPIIGMVCYLLYKDYMNDQELKKKGFLD